MLHLQRRETSRRRPNRDGNDSVLCRVEARLREHVAMAPAKRRTTAYLHSLVMRLLEPTRHLAILQAFFGEGIQVLHAFALVIPASFLLLGRRQRASATSAFLLPVHEMPGSTEMV